MTWTKAQIRDARKVELAPVLRARGLQLQSLSGGNFRVMQYDDLVVKRCYWRWPSRGIDGNAIDFFMLVEHKTFNQAMEALSGVRNRPQTPSDRFKNPPEIPSHGSAPKPQQTHQV